MKKITKIILATVIALSLSAMTGCNKKETKEEDGYQSKQDFKDNIQSKKKITVDGKEEDEFTMKDGMKIQGEGLEDAINENEDSE